VTLEPVADVSLDELLITAPRGITGLLTTVVHTRGKVALAVERGTTMSDLASALASQDRQATITAREPDGTTWSISLGATERPEATSSADAARL
jgi:hypothetical protein